jgi:hypothetical protein
MSEEGREGRKEPISKEGKEGSTDGGRREERKKLISEEGKEGRKEGKS